MAQFQPTVDESGHSGYCVVIMAPPDIQEAIGNIRNQLDIPVPMIPAHVTAKGTFTNPPSIDAICNIISSTANETSPLVLELDDYNIWGQEDSRAYVARIKSSPELDTLHENLFQAIDPITTNVYGPEAAKNFHFHMTIYQEVDEANHKKGLELTSSLELPQSMKSDSMCLMGRVGPRGPGGIWHIIQEFHF